MHYTTPGVSAGPDFSLDNLNSLHLDPEGAILALNTKSFLGDDDVTGLSLSLSRTLSTHQSVCLSVCLCVCMISMYVCRYIYIYIYIHKRACLQSRWCLCSI